MASEKIVESDGIEGNLPRQLQLLSAENNLLRAENQDLIFQVEKLRSRRHDLEKKLSLHSKSGLPSHYQMDIDLGELIASYADKGEARTFTLLILQLHNNFNMIRKSLKASVSEWVLYQLGVRMSSLLGPSDRVYHTRDNEFVLFLHRGPGAELKTFLNEMFSKLNEPHIFSGFNLTVPVSAGAAFYPDHGQDKSILLHHADIALGAALEEKKPFQVFKDSLLEQVVEKIELQNSIIKAIEAPALAQIGQQFHMYFQPKLHIKAIEGDVIHVEYIEAEALIRWEHPQRGTISPDKFIPLAEETGLIMPLGKWTIYQSLNYLQSWQKTLGPLGISVNLSARQFHSEDILDVFSNIMETHPINPGSLTVELTETSLFEDPMQASDVMKRFKNLGILISVDDFGTGYSSLSHLHKFPLDEIKIDKLFIESFLSNRHDRIIVRSLVTLAKEMGMKLVAEGVEHPAVLRKLYDMGCTGFQGYLLSRPLAPQDFAQFYKKIADNGFKLTVEGL